MGHQIKPKVCEGCKVPKGWGEELIIENNEMYCGKLLIFKKGCKFSMHYHIIKKESWYVAKGSFEYKLINTETAEEESLHIKVGDCITIERGHPHQLIALENNSEVFEVSTQHFDPDSYRVKKGDSQK